jgi:hypothetical protein
MYREFLRFKMQTCCNPSRSGFHSVIIKDRSGNYAYFNFGSKEQAEQAFKRVIKKGKHVIANVCETLKRLCGDDVNDYGLYGSGSQGSSPSSSSSS